MAKFETYTKRIASLDEKIQALHNKRELRVKERQKVCIHRHIKQSGGEEWFDYCEVNNHGYNPFILTCTDCGLRGDSQRYVNNKDNPDYFIYEELNKIKNGE